MKRLSRIALSPLLALALALPAAAQYRQGMGSFGLSASLINRDGINSSDNSTAFYVNPLLGYSLSDNWMVGARFDYGVLEDGDAQLFGLAPFLRYNAPIAERVGVFARLSPNFTTTNYENESSIRTLGVEATVGGYVFISQKFSVQAEVGRLAFSNTSFRDPDGEEMYSLNAFDLGASMSALSFSLLYHF